MKTFVNTIPKSGTYLVREVLENLGLGASHLHISERGTYDYSKVTKEEGRRYPERCLVRKPLDRSLNDIPKGSFAVGHLKYKPNTITALNDLRIIFVGRSPKETIISYLIYNIETGRGNRSSVDKEWMSINNPREQFLRYIDLRASRLLETYKNILQWKTHPGVYAIDFNELKRDPLIQVAKLASVVHRSNVDIQQVVDASFNKETQTLSKLDKNKFWSDKAHHELDKLIYKMDIRYD